MYLLKRSNLLFIMLMFYTHASFASLLDLEQSPLFITNTVKPNVFFLVDDSGSMDWEILTNQYWHFCAYNPLAGNTILPDSSECGWKVTEDIHRSYGKNGYRYFEYLFHNADNSFQDDCNGDSNNSIASCTEAGDADWRIYSNNVNVIYYDPSNNYVPWGGACLTDGTACANANFTSARSNPRQNTAGYNNTNNLNGLFYNVWQDDKGYSGDRPQRGTNLNATTTANNEVDLWDSHINIVLETSQAKIYSVTYNPNALSLNETKNLEATLTSPTACYNVLGTKDLVKQIFDGTLSYTSTDGAGCRTISQAQTNFANWYQYSRRRGMIAKGAVGMIIDTFPTFRYGLSVLNNHSKLFVEMPTSDVTDYASHNTNIINQLFEFEWPPQGTPLRRGLERAGKYFAQELSSHPTSPITEACQQNFTVLLTDSKWNGQAPSSVTHDSDQDGVSGTFADVAHYFYLKDLSTLNNEVIPNAYDSATWQHMVTFAVSFGAAGDLVDTDGDGWPNPALTESGNWGNPFETEPAKIDDLWHGAYNSKGLFARAQTPNEVTDKLTEVFQNITERISSATSVAQNSTLLQSDSAIYQSRFHSLSWKGELLAYSIDLNGQIASEPNWSSGCVLTGGDCSLPSVGASQNPGISPNSRVIITKGKNNGSSAGIPFRWSNLHAALQENNTYTQRLSDFLKYAPFAPSTTEQSEIDANEAYGQALLDYLRGVRTHEIQNGGAYAFRDRDSILGDIVHSDPLYVGPPNRYYPDSFETLSYSTFKTTYANRKPIVYTGSNSGALHGFDASNGKELIAFVPGIREIYENLASLSKSTYTHKYFVDGSPNEADVFINNNWRTILTVPLRNGGQGLSVLDITDPNNFNENNASSLFLWEFSDEDDPDLGYIHGKAQIAKVKTGANSSKWAVIISNGYNNSQSDSATSTSGQAALYVLFIENGLDGTWTQDVDYIKISVGPTDVNTPNGLSEPFLVDIDGDYIVDYVYAGDLRGNLWKFDLTNTTPTQWKSAAKAIFTAKYSTAGDQPITASPVVNFHPNGPSAGLMIYFGTGKFLENSDNNATGNTTQSLYAIWDKLDGTIPTKDDLLQQKILSESSVSVDTTGDGNPDTTYELRQTTTNGINWSKSVDGGAQQNLGWYMDLIIDGQTDNKGERYINKPILRNNNVIFTTMIPSQTICDFGGSSWLMELNAEDGSALSIAPFDLNEDGLFDNQDYMLIDGTSDNKQYAPPGGIKSTVGIAASPTVFINQDKSKEVKVLSGSTGLGSISENPNNSPMGRQNWRPLK